MERAVVCKGDRTTHGGTVLEGAELFLCDGRAVAAKGHMTFCPQCRGKFPIIEGLDFHTAFGHGTVLDQMATGCGAHVIASPNTMMFVDDRANGPADAAGHATSAALANQTDVFSTRFRIVDELTGEPLPHQPYRVRLPDGSTLRGVTDEDGNTERIVGHEPASVALEWDSDDDVSDQH